VHLVLWQILIIFFTLLIVSPLLVTTAVAVMFNLTTKSGLSPYIMVFFAITALIASYVMARWRQLQLVSLGMLGNAAKWLGLHHDCRDFRSTAARRAKRHLAKQAAYGYSACCTSSHTT
jgi:hypothetical protein